MSEPIPCACGCGGAPRTPGRRWLPGHSSRKPPRGTCGSCGKVIATSLKTRHKCSGCRVDERRERVRLAVVILGGRCIRCGIAKPLHMDHINDDGYRNKTANGRYRRLMQAEQAEITQILKTGRSERLQLLCPNCNYLKHHDRAGYDCPPTYGPL